MERPGNFLGRNVDRFFLVGCSPYNFLQGTKSELLPPLTRDGYRLERDTYLKEQWDKLPQEEKDEYGFERETQDILQACIDAQDERQRAEEAALKEAGSEELIDKTSGFTFPRNATAEQIEALRSTKHHAAWMGLRDILKRMLQQRLPAIGEERDGKVYGARNKEEPGAKRWETVTRAEGEARPGEGAGRDRSRDGDRGDRGDRDRGDRDRGDRDRGDRDRGDRDRGDRDRRDRDRGDRDRGDRSREKDRGRDRDRERDRSPQRKKKSPGSEKTSRRSPSSSADDSWLSDSANKHRRRKHKREKEKREKKDKDKKKKPRRSSSSS